MTSAATASVPENTTAVTTVTATDPDAGATITFSITGGADAAKFAITTGGVLSFLVAPNFEAPTDAGANNVYDVTVQASDGLGGTTTQAIAVTVTNVNEAPVAVADPNFTVQTGTLLSVPAPGVLANDTDPDAGTTLTAVLGTTTANGTLALNANGSFTYTSNAGFTGTDTFTYRASDGTLTSALATVTITVNAVPNQAPIITSNGGGDTAAVNAPENQTAVTTVTATDANNDPLTFSITGGADAAKFAITTGGVLSFLVAPNFEAPT